MTVVATAIPDVLLIKPAVFEDDRGFFYEWYNRRKYRELGINADFVQDNHSGSRGGTLRGLHYQVRHVQGKMIRVLVGEIYDVAVDLRAGSQTFGKWVAEVLSAENRRMLWIPPGFAHGYYVLSEWAEVEYKVTDYYSPKHERTLLWNDPQVGVEWPIEGGPPTISDKDASGKLFREIELPSPA